jgi:aromatic ring hydroxylase
MALPVTALATGARTGEQFLEGLRQGGPIRSSCAEVITDTGWRSHIMHQAFTRAWVKLSFALGLGHLIATTTGVARFDHIQEKLGQMWSMSELARSAIVAAESGAVLDPGGVMTPDERPFVVEQFLHD